MKPALDLNRFCRCFREVVSLPSALKGSRKLFVALGDQGRSPAVFHWTTGKDVTGWAASALLSLVGMPRETIMKDYQRSNDCIPPAYQKAIDAFIVAGGDKEIPLAVRGMKQEHLDATFGETETKWGTIENYFPEELGVDATQQKDLKDLYLH